MDGKKGFWTNQGCDMIFFTQKLRMLLDWTPSHKAKAFGNLFELNFWQLGCTIRSILPSGMGALGVSSEHVENMEVLKILTYALVSTWSLVGSEWEDVKRKMHPCLATIQMWQLIPSIRMWWLAANSCLKIWSYAHMHLSEWCCFARRPPISMTESSSQENCKIGIDWKKKTHLAISFYGKTPVLVCLNKSKKAKKGRCLKCNSIRCAHVQAWNQELKKSLLKNLLIKDFRHVLMVEVETENEIGEMGSEEESEDFETLLIEWSNLICNFALNSVLIFQSKSFSSTLVQIYALDSVTKKSQRKKNKFPSLISVMK